MEALAQAMQSDRQITLAIGQPATIFYASKVLLESTSPYFTSALRNQHLGNVEKDTLTFPDEDLTAWKVLLFWMVKGTLPEESEMSPGDEIGTYQWTCVDCWALGDKYSIPDFQDLVMLELLLEYEVGLMLSLDAAKASFDCSAPGSKLRELMAEEIAESFASGDLTTDDLDAFDGVTGFASALATKLRSPGNLDHCGFRPRVP